ncbi:superoxide dismutase family protein [Aquimarina brevivitae]|uniref:Cu-Zn family superoxide dismutase n=1 Tax=Aquimarina brevivitae TaxID=323412 RepID=A0A4V2F5M7_9FLAO|nr:superoxide dismutase family protein [Aquimarina brevivitae]RZS93359.1 Cu-Zn family superoxide dismutase [Aquimarina brevivitae]
MKILNICSIFIFSLLLLNCKGEKKVENEETTKEEVKQVPEVQKDEVTTLEIMLEPKSESDVSGKVVFTQASGMVNMTAELSGLEEGTHAIHIHEKADCTSPDGKSTGGHWNPTMQPHGKWGDAAGYHKGDIGNFKADADGNGNITFATNEWCIGCDDEKKNIVGKAIIVHQGEDDFTSQPSGAAGSRVSCGGIIQ